MIDRNKFFYFLFLGFICIADLEIDRTNYTPFGYKNKKKLPTSESPRQLPGSSNLNLNENGELVYLGVWAQIPNALDLAFKSYR